MWEAENAGRCLLMMKVASPLLGRINLKHGSTGHHLIMLLPLLMQACNVFSCGSVLQEGRPWAETSARTVFRRGEAKNHWGVWAERKGLHKITKAAPVHCWLWAIDHHRQGRIWRGNSLPSACLPLWSSDSWPYTSYPVKGLSGSPSDCKICLISSAALAHVSILSAHFSLTGDFLSEIRSAFVKNMVSSHVCTGAAGDLAMIEISHIGCAISCGSPSMMARNSTKILL